MCYHTQGLALRLRWLPLLNASVFVYGQPALLTDVLGGVGWLLAYHAVVLHYVLRVRHYDARWNQKSPSLPSSLVGADVLTCTPFRVSI